MDFKILLCLDFKSLVANQIYIRLVTPHVTNGDLLLLKKSSLLWCYKPGLVTNRDVFLLATLRYATLFLVLIQSQVK